MSVSSHHHADEREEVSVALHSRESKRNDIREEDHGWAEADGAEDLREDVKERWIILARRRGSVCVGKSSTDHSGEVAACQQVSRVEAEEDEVHRGQDEVVEGDVHRRLAAPVGWR